MTDTQENKLPTPAGWDFPTSSIRPAIGMVVCAVLALVWAVMAVVALVSSRFLAFALLILAALAVLSASLLLAANFRTATRSLSEKLLSAGPDNLVGEPDGRDGRRR